MRASTQSWQAILDRPTQELCDYNALDVEHTWLADEKLAADAAYFGVQATADRMLRLALPAYRMQERGMLGDQDVRAKLLASVNDRLEERTLLIVGLFTEQLGDAMRAAVVLGGVLRRILNPRRKAELKSAAFNPRSKAHLILLFQSLGMKWSQTTEKTGAPQFDLDVIMKLRRAYPDHEPILMRLWEYKKLEKLRADWLEDGKGKRLVCNDGRLRASVRVTGTQSGRFSEAGRDWCARCQAADHGRNRQNLPKADDDFSNEHAPIRSMIVPGAGNSLVCVDYAALEAWIAARLSMDPVFLSRLESGSIHAENAKDLFGLPAGLSVADVKNDFALQYRMAKIFLYGGVLYLGGPETIRSSYEEHGIIVPLADVKKQQARWKTKHQVFVNWQYRTIAEAAQQRPMRTKTALGRHRIFFGAHREWGRDCLAHKISGTGADYVNEAMIELDATLPPWPDAGILLHNHDELVVECRTELKDAVARRMVTAFETDRGFGVFKAECKVSEVSFHDTHDWIPLAA